MTSLSGRKRKLAMTAFCKYFVYFLTYCLQKENSKQPSSTSRIFPRFFETNVAEFGERAWCSLRSLCVSCTVKSGEKNHDLTDESVQKHEK